MSDIKYYLRELDKLQFDIEHDTYLLTRDDISSLVWRIESLKSAISETYDKRGVKEANE